MPETQNTELVAAAFDSKSAAVKARAALERADRDMQVVQLNRIAIIEKGKDGKLTFSEADKKKSGVWSLAHNAAFVVGSALGKGATLLPDKWAEDTAALAARLKDSGFPDEALAEIGEGLAEGVAVVITLVDDDDEKAIVSRSLVEHGGKLIHKTLSKDAVDRLSQATLADKTAGSASGLAAVVAGATGAAKGAAQKAKAVDASGLVDNAKGATAVATGAAKSATGAATGAAKSATEAATGAAKSATGAATGAAKSATGAATGAAKKVTKTVDVENAVDTAKGMATVATGVAIGAITDPAGTAKDMTALAKGQAKKLTGKGEDAPPAEEVKKTVKAATATIPVTVKAATPDEGAAPPAEPAPAASQAAPAETPAPVAAKPASTRKKAAPPDDLQRLPDVGPVYERLLHASGITTYAQVARLSADKLRAIFSGDDPESGLPVMEISAEQAKAIKAAAKQLAASKAA